MKNLKLFKILTGLFLMVFIISCDKEEAVDASSELQDVVFDITNFIPNSVSGKGMLSSKDEEVELPECSDKVADYVAAVIDGQSYTLKLVTLNEGMETEVVKLAPGPHTLDGFVVYDDNDTPGDITDDVAIYASPMNGSYYQNLWGLDGVSKEFVVDAFQKRKISIDVLCYKPYAYESFGFAWFQYAKYQVKTICFFGDICTKFYEEFHREDEKNPYFGQDYDGYDFAAIFEIVIHNEYGEVVNDQSINSNASWYGVGQPLCIEYPDQVGVQETFTFDIWLAMPDGSGKIVYTGSFDDTASSDAGNADGFGGADGIFDFVVGNCSYDGNDANMEIPAYIPLPETLDITVLAPTNNTYLDVTISNVIGGQAFNQLYNGLTIGAWCGDLFNAVIIGETYTADVYSSLDIEGMPANYATYGDAWNALNWLINNHDLNSVVESTSFSSEDIQNGIWNLIHGLSLVDNGFMAWAGIDLSSGLISVDPVITDFVPTVGDWAFVLLDPREALEQEDLVQLLIVQVDP